MLNLPPLYIVLEDAQDRCVVVKETILALEYLSLPLLRVLLIFIRIILKLSEDL